MIVLSKGLWLVIIKILKKVTLLTQLSLTSIRKSSMRAPLKAMIRARIESISKAQKSQRARIRAQKEKRLK